MRIVIALSLAGALLAPVAVLAAPAAPTLTLEQAVSLALSHQPQLARARADLAGARAGVRQAEGVLGPQLSLATSYQLGPARQNVNQVGVPVTNLGTYAAGLSADQLLFDFGQGWRRAQASASQAEAQARNVRGTEQEVVLQVRTAYFAAQASEALLGVARDTVANRQRQEGRVRSLVEVGSRAPIELAQATRDLARARLDLINADSGLQLARAQLAQAMGRPPADGFRLAPASMPPVAGEEHPLAALVAEALANRPDVAALEARVQAQLLTLEAAERATLPGLRASAGAGTNGSPVGTPNNFWNLGVGLSWPLYTSGQREAQAEASRASLEAVRAEAEGLRQQVRLAVGQAQLRVATARAATQAADAATQAAWRQLQLAEGRYAAGLGSILELGDAQLAHASARAQGIQERFNLATARAALLRALGRE
ncbi:MAG: TolC family protein [Candidatus Sericytochromatia bacterium]|nr:TolC family protein [Candidatus Sericytochromatia bacterium]